jgi:hypothetical protein
MPLSYLFKQMRPYVAMFALAAGLTSCADKDTPEFRLTAEQRTWGDAYREGDTWRFRNAAGYERRYKVTNFKDKMQAHVPKSLSVTHRYQLVEATIERQDSTTYKGSPFQNKYSMLFELQAEVVRGTPYDSKVQQLTWTTSVALPIDAINTQPIPPAGALPSGVQFLPQLTIAGRTYENVLEFTTTHNNLAWQAKKIYYTKAEGVIRFEENGGEVWDRQ